MPTPTRPYRGVGADERRAVRRAALLEAALDLLGGAERTPVTMTAICQRAGLTERYFYESFKDRDALLVELLDSIAREVMDEVRVALEEHGPEPQERVREAVRALVRILVADPRKGRVALLESMTVPVLRTRREELLAAFATLTAERTRALYGERAWSSPDDTIESLLVVGGLAELLGARLSGRLDVADEVLVEAATRHYLATAHR